MPFGVKMSSGFTASDKKKAAALIIILFLLAITFIIDFSDRTAASAYIVGVIVLAVLFEAYIYSAYVSDRSGDLSHADIYILGVAPKSKTRIYVDERYVHRLSGECNGASLKFPSGMHKITFYNGTDSAAVNTVINDCLVIRVHVRGASMTIDAEYREHIAECMGTEYGYKMNKASFILFNLVLLLVVFRIIGLLLWWSR